MAYSSHGIFLKKQHGQNFLRDQQVANHILEAVNLDKNSSVFEIGCGDGFLTQTIVQYPFERLWVFEIDPEWSNYVRGHIKDPRMTMYNQDILTTDFSIFEEHKPWTLLSNLPYHITFMILHLLQQQRHLLKEGVIMVQEEVAAKIVKTEGRGYGYISLFFQYYFDWKKLDKVQPTAFHPAPKVYSRLLYFKPKASIQPIPDEENFWRFIKQAFKQPRRTLRNNLATTHYDLNRLPADLLQLRAQQMDMPELLRVWDIVRGSIKEE